jgi:hypothetical protein
MAKKKEKSGPKPAIEMTEEFLDKVESLARKQFTQEQIRDYFGVKKSCWYHTKQKYPEISKRIKKGRSQLLEFVVNKFLEKVEQGDTKCILFYLERKAKWLSESSLKLDAKIKTDKNSPIELKITTTDPVEAGKIYEQIMTTGS